VCALEQQRITLIETRSFNYPPVEDFSPLNGAGKFKIFFNGEDGISP